MSEDYPHCVSTRKDGRPCLAVGIAFDPDQNGMVCDAHMPIHLDTPQNRAKRARAKAQIEMVIEDRKRAAK